MPKINFTKVEGAFDQALQKLTRDHLSELATIATVIHERARLSDQALEGLILRFQKELDKLRHHDPKLYARLALSKEEEERLQAPFSAYLQRDWLRLRELKVRIDELKRELYGQERIDREYEQQVRKERRRHINKRFNIRDGWLPLH